MAKNMVLLLNVWTLFVLL